MVSWKLHGKILIENNCINHLEKITSFSFVIFFSFWSFDMNSCWSLASSGQLAWELSSFVNRTIIKVTVKHKLRVNITRKSVLLSNYHRWSIWIKFVRNFCLVMFIIMDKRKFLYEISNSKQTNTKGQGWVLQKN